MTRRCWIPRRAEQSTDRVVCLKDKKMNAMMMPLLFSWRIPLSADELRSPLGRAERGRGTPGGRAWCNADGKGGTRGVATGMAARFRLGRLWDELFRGGRDPAVSPEPWLPPPPGRFSGELQSLSESEYTAVKRVDDEIWLFVIFARSCSHINDRQLANNYTVLVLEIIPFLYNFYSEIIILFNSS